MSLSLRLRLTLWYGLLLGLSLLAFGSLLYLVLQANLEQQVDQALQLRGVQLGRQISPGADGALESIDLGPGQLGPTSVEEAPGPSVYVQVLDRQANVIGTWGSQLPIDPEAVIAGLAGEQSLASVPLSGGRTVRVLTRPLTLDGEIIGVVQVGQTLDAVAATLGQVRDILLLASAAVLAVAGIGGLLLGGRALAPVRRVSETARSIAATGDYAQRLPHRAGSDEIGELVSTFNAMIERVERSHEEQRRFLADTSHELRTPLTVIRANLGFLWRDTDLETRADCLREAEAEATRMSRLVQDLLLLGQVEAGDLLQRVSVVLPELLDEVVEQARAQADEKRIELGVVHPVTMQGDRDRLKQLLWNLVENALRYTPTGSTIRLSLYRDGDWAELAITDDGPGIMPEHLPRLFDRFYRVDHGRSRATGGAGLGLAIVKHIAEAHGGNVGVESVVGVGTTFRVRLPAERQEMGGIAPDDGRETGPPHSLTLFGGAQR